MDYASLAHLYDHWVDQPGFPLEHDFPLDEYELRLGRSRAWMREAGLDALVITSSGVGRWFTSRREPHEWHDLCSSRSAWYVLTADRDVLFMTPTAGGEHFATTRRSTWVSEIRAIVERVAGRERVEIWGLEQIPEALAALGLSQATLGFELGDGMTLGLSVNDFLSLRQLMPEARLVDGSSVIRRLMSVLTPWEVSQLGEACHAADWIHAQVPDVIRAGLTEREAFDELEMRFRDHYGDAFDYVAAGLWDVRNASDPSSNNVFHAVPTDRPYRVGDVIFRGYSGVSRRGYIADTDRIWVVGSPTQAVRDLYRMTWECNRAMAAAIRPGTTCREVYAAGAAAEARLGQPTRLTGRTGHGLRNVGSLSVHPDNWTVLEPGMVISVEPMYACEHGFFDLEDQYLVTDTGAVCLHDPAPLEIPVIEA
jgi:Xaa-Pro dipeptidase